MRVIFELETGRVEKIPANLRQRVLSMIKKAFEISDEYGSMFLRYWYSSQKPKPFTFSVYIPMNGKENNKDSFLKLVFSTNNLGFLYRTYNGILKLSQGYEKFILINEPVRLKRITSLPEKKFFSEETVFETISPLLVRDHKDGDFYIYPVECVEDTKNFTKFKYWKGVDKKVFIEELNYSLKSLAKHFLGKEEKIEILEFEPLRLIPISLTNRKFKMTLPGIKGILKIRGSAEVLKLFYDIGIGARRSEGFGMLDIRRTVSDVNKSI